jgi:hypothetical protein
MNVQRCLARSRKALLWFAERQDLVEGRRTDHGSLAGE